MKKWQNVLEEPIQAAVMGLSEEVKRTMVVFDDAMNSACFMYNAKF